jgi:hypothetical protein
MSSLREIMQKLAQTESTKRRSGDFSEIIKYHVDDYQGKLDECTPEMLRYEWAWISEHTEALELCLAQPAMSNEIGGFTRVELLLEESKQFKIALERAFHQRMIHPGRHHHPVNPLEHAWELSENKLKQAWGIA